MPTKEGPLPLSSRISYRIDLQHTMKGFPGGIRNEALCALGKLAEHAFR